MCQTTLIFLLYFTTFLQNVKIYEGKKSQGYQIS